MASPVSVIIAALNDEACVGEAVDSALAAGAAEVIVCDGGSSDRTGEVAMAHGARLITSGTMRSRQLNRGASEAANDHLIFLHADTRLPAGAAAAVVRALRDGVIFGGFRLTFAEPARKLRVAERMINFRTAITRCPWGDQAQFIHRNTFREIGGFREIPLMEDYDLAIRMKRRGRTTVLPMPVITSGRRFLQKGVWRTAAINWRIIISYRLGADPVDLWRIYRS
jgi:rSAM/selenodomain-associated transferase 2